MRNLILTRGAMGCGKSTWIKQRHLEAYALSADDFRLKYTAPTWDVHGKPCIIQDRFIEDKVWDALYAALEIRMARGEFTVVDSCNTKTIEMNKFVKLAEKYRYRVYCVDFTDLPIEECKRRNALRPMVKRVPESAIDKAYARFEGQVIPKKITVIKPDGFDRVMIHPLDFSSYEKIVFVGDIHGCNTALQEYFHNEISDKYFYIFVGDYLDRGIENAEVFKFIYSIKDRRNVLLLTGNHEAHQWFMYVNELEKHPVTGYKMSGEFTHRTLPQLLAAGITREMVDQVYMKLGQCAYFTYNGTRVLVTHAGIPCLPKNGLSFLATDSMIHGIGEYGDAKTVANSWSRHERGIYQVFGHRNETNLKERVNKYNFDLTNDVEHGGTLRILELDKEGFHQIEIKNKVFAEIAKDTDMSSVDVPTLLLALRSAKTVDEKQLGGGVSSFNFTRAAFIRHKFDPITEMARSLYIDTVRQVIRARAYNKFFQIGETHDTEYGSLAKNIKMPIEAYKKENGFLGLVSYDPDTDGLYIATKSTTEGDFAGWFKEILAEDLKDAAYLTQYLKEHNETAIFECIDPDRNPHIIKEPRRKVVLLDLAKNEVDFKVESYEDLCAFAKKCGLEVKERVAVFTDWDSFYKWSLEVAGEGYVYNGAPIEGFVARGSNGFMVKIKGAYYLEWKKMRGVADKVMKYGYLDKTSHLTDALQNRFYNWVKANKDAIAAWPRKDIITLREAFEKEVADGRKG
jgi:predicted kinase